MALPSDGWWCAKASDDGSGRVVFFVDDEPPIVEVGCRMLEKLGFEPRGFSSGFEALAAFEEDPGAVDLVVSDLSMEELRGDQMAERMRRLRPDLPIILSSGYSDADDADRAVSRGLGAFLGKPYSMEDLAEAVEGLLGPLSPAGGGE